MRSLVIALFLFPWITGCSEISTLNATKVDLSHFQHLYVEHLLTDGRGIDGIIARELRQRGYDALAGPRQLMPTATEVVIHYEDHWNFDFTNYMIGLDLDVRGARTDKLLATAQYFRPSFVGETPIDMIDVVLNKFFKPRGKPVPEPAPPPGPESTSPST